jgi:chromosome partitioning protein
VAGDKPALVILNGLHLQATRQAEEAKRMIAELFSFPVCPIHLSRLDIFAETQTTGTPPLEEEPQGKAALELKRLHGFISELVNKSESPHVENAKSAAGA